MAEDVSKDITVRIQRDTEKYRKGDGTVRVVDRNGRPVEGAEIEIEQITHDFLFGCNIYMFNRLETPEANEKYKAMFKRLFNYATLPYYWKNFEREQGVCDYARTEAMAKWCSEHGITMKGHPLVWACHTAGVPTWLPKDDHAEVKRLMEARLRDVMTHYKDSIHIWDVVNESTHGERFAGMSVFDFTSQPVRWARETDPKATLLVNEFGIFTTRQERDAYLKLLRELNAANVPYDAIGLQSHMHHGLYPIPTILSVLDEFAALGKPLHLTEMTALSGAKGTNPADEKKQAEYVEQFYRACFSHPAVRAITWWDFSDAGAWLNATAGVTRADMTPKPVYHVLDRLINKEWTTRLRGSTGSDGAFSFRGFGGKYRVKVTPPDGKTATGEFHLSEGKGDGEWLIADG